MKKNNKKGFTLAELLIVVAIIAVLVAISIPVFTTQLHKAKVATDEANCRSLYADLQTAFLTDGYNANATTLNNANTFNLTDGQQIKLQDGFVSSSVTNNGWYVEYKCNQDGHTEHVYNWGVKQTND